MNADEAANEAIADLYSFLEANDPSLTELKTEQLFLEFGNSQARRLGEALRENSHVIRLEIHFSDFSDTQDDSFDGVLAFIGTSTSLQECKLVLVDLPSAALLNRFLLAIAANNSNRLQQVTLAYMNANVDAFATLLTATSTTVKHLLLVECRLIDSSCHEKRELAANALGQNTTLEKLTLRCGFAFHETLFQHLRAHPRLKVLELHASNGSAPSNLFGSGFQELLSNTSTLSHLELNRFSFDDEAITGFGAGIRASPRLCKLSLRNCFFDTDATSLFVDLMKSSKSGIRMLRLEHNNRFGPLLTGVVVAQILHSGVSSTPLRELVMETGESPLPTPVELPLVFGALQKNAISTPLRSFSYKSMDAVGCGAMIESLPELYHLKELSISALKQDVFPHMVDVLRALKQNGSLERVSLTMSSHTNLPFFGRNQMRQVQRNCQRNRQLPQLVQRPKQNSRDVEGTPVGAYPRLFCAAMQAPRTGPTSLLLGLLALGDLIGPRRQMTREAHEPAGGVIVEPQLV